MDYTNITNVASSSIWADATAFFTALSATILGWITSLDIYDWITTTAVYHWTNTASFYYFTNLTAIFALFFWCANPVAKQAAKNLEPLARALGSPQSRAVRDAKANIAGYENLFYWMYVIIFFALVICCPFVSFWVHLVFGAIVTIGLSGSFCATKVEIFPAIIQTIMAILPRRREIKVD